MGFVERVERLIKRPFSTDGDLIDFFLVVGLTILTAFLWSRVVRMIAAD